MFISIIVEWENAVLSELQRARDMLRRMQAQALARSGDQFEILVMYNPEQVQRGLIEGVLATDAVAELKNAFRLVAAPGMHYYDLKNEGARLASGEVIVFLDSDVIPDDGWLDGLLGVLETNPGVNVVTGSYYVDPVDFVGRAFAVNWFFTLRPAQAAIGPCAKFFANNVAFRKAFFLDRQFPAMPPGSTRGACGMLAKSILAEGQEIIRQPMSSVSHPAPNGSAHIALRALAQGRDSAFKHRHRLNPLTNSVRIWLRVLKRALIRVPYRTLRDHGKVGMPLWQVPAAMLLMIAYYLLVGIGGQAAILAPDFMSRHIRV
jgi:hypothetical protein